MKKNILLLSCLLIASLGFAQPADWVVRPGDFSNSGSATIKVMHNAGGVTEGTLAAFYNNEIRGVVTATFFPPTGDYLFLLTMYSNVASGETLLFKYYNPTDGQIYDIDETLDFVSDMILGTAPDPLEFTFTTLPITLSYFDAVIKDSNVSLSWQTISEQNVSHFEILRSYDSREWEYIGAVNALGYSSGLMDYQYVDEKIASSIRQNRSIYYQLKSVDFDGEEELTDIRSVYFDTEAEVKLFPNPACDLLYISHATNGPLKVIIFDSSGQLVYESDYENPLDISKFQPGLYSMKIFVDGAVFTKNFIHIGGK